MRPRSFDRVFPFSSPVSRLFLSLSPSLSTTWQESSSMACHSCRMRDQESPKPRCHWQHRWDSALPGAEVRVCQIFCWYSSFWVEVCVLTGQDRISGWLDGRPGYCGVAGMGRGPRGKGWEMVMSRSRGMAGWTILVLVDLVLFSLLCGWKCHCLSCSGRQEW